jgi:hypothetical protein
MKRIEPDTIRELCRMFYVPHTEICWRVSDDPSSIHFA